MRHADVRFVAPAASTRNCDSVTLGTASRTSGRRGRRRMRIISADKKTCLDFDRTALTIWQNSANKDVFYLCGQMSRVNYTLGAFRSKEKAYAEMLDIIKQNDKGAIYCMVEGEVEDGD